VNASALPEQPCGDDTRIIEDEELMAPEQVGQPGKKSILETPRGAIQQKEPRGIATFKRALGNLPARKMVVEFIKTHGKRQSTSKSANASKTKELAAEGWLFIRGAPRISNIRWTSKNA
jgi:hypothetical protein